MHGQNYFQQVPSLAVYTLTRYNGGGGNNNVAHKFTSNNTGNVETRTHPSTGLQHPYDNERNFLSRFPIGFDGCYNYEKRDHRNTRDYLKAINGQIDKQKFFQEL